MTRSERFIRNREWLKIHKFAITNSLEAKMAAREDLTKDQRELCCYVQSKVLQLTRKRPKHYVNIGVTYFQDRCGWTYRRWLDLLVEWDELDVNTRYRHGADGKPGFSMSYRIPPIALRSGCTTVDFRRRSTPIADKTDTTTADPIIRHVHACCSRLTIAEELVSIPDPILDAAAHECCRRVFWKDFNIRYGERGRRLFHSIIEMPRAARANIIFREGGHPLFDYDIKSCHPVLLLPLFSDPLEREKFSVVLQNDVYLTIRRVMGICEHRNEIKIQFMVCTNSTDRHSAAPGPVHQFFRTYFPVFAREVLDVRPDLAVFLQQQESRIMVQEIGRLCMEKNHFWIPCHDGWIGTEDGEKEIGQTVIQEFLRLTGYSVQIEKHPLANPLSSSLFFGGGGGVGGSVGSYVRMEDTFFPSENGKRALEWFKDLPKHPDPDPELLKTRSRARELRKQAFKSHRRRGRESERLRQKARPLWSELMAEN